MLANHRVVLIAPLTPAWSATIDALKTQCERVTFYPVIPPVTRAEL